MIFICIACLILGAGLLLVSLQGDEYYNASLAGTLFLSIGFFILGDINIPDFPDDDEKIYQRILCDPPPPKPLDLSPEKPPELTAE